MVLLTIQHKCGQYEIWICMAPLQYNKLPHTQRERSRDGGTTAGDETGGM